MTNRDKACLEIASFHSLYTLHFAILVESKNVWNKWSMYVQNFLWNLCLSPFFNNKNISFSFSTDEPATDFILKGLQTFASVCNQLELNSNHDAFISCICKMSLPQNYVANNLNSLLSKQLQTYEINAVPGVLIKDGTYEFVATPNNIVVHIVLFWLLNPSPVASLISALVYKNKSYVCPNICEAL